MAASWMRFSVPPTLAAEAAVGIKEVDVGSGVQDHVGGLGQVLESVRRQPEAGPGQVGWIGRHSLGQQPRREMVAGQRLSQAGERVISVAGPHQAVNSRGGRAEQLIE
jgi:hypothetical protein